MLRSDQPGRLRSSSGAAPRSPSRARAAAQEVIPEGSGRAGVWGRPPYLRTEGLRTRVGGAGGAAAAAPTDDVTQRPSREPWRGGCSRALPGRSLGRIMEADPAPAPDSVSALLRPSYPCFLLVLFPPPCFSASLPSLGGELRGCSSFHRRGFCERICWRLPRQLWGLDTSPPPLRAPSRVGSRGRANGERWGP